MPPDQPRFVPTLTEVVRVGDPPPAVAAAATVAGSPSVPVASREDVLPAASPKELALQQDLAEQMAHRVLQRIDTALESRLAEAIRAAVVRHTEALLPALREEIVMTVQTAVTDALAEEFPPHGDRDS